jgi:MoaA/NifB/PqqE/SkfB family radical SAM enzyme
MERTSGERAPAAELNIVRWPTAHDACTSVSSGLELSPEENAALAQAEFESGATVLRSTPRSLTIETTSRCNLRCVMCPHGYGKIHRPKHFDENLAQKMLNFLGRARSVQLHGIGEPTNSPSFWRMLRYLPSPQLCNSSINTNFSVIDDNRLNDLLNSNLRFVNVSLDAASEMTYQRIRGFSFNIVINNIERFLRARRERCQKFPHVGLNMTLMRTNIEEVCDFVRLGARLGVEVLMLWHMNRCPDEEVADFVTERDGWIFDYCKEGLWNFPALSNRCLKDAVALANHFGVKLLLDKNKGIYFDE